MSKTFTVKEVAAALGITPRGVVQRLNRNQLKGTRKTNQFGTSEWQVYATKEITQAIEALRADPASVRQQQSFAPEAEENYDDTIDAEGVDVDDSFEQPDWIELERKRLELLAETLVKPLTEQLALQAAALREKELQLAEKDRQLRLLPDLQKQAEEERKAAELKELEAEALRKQIAALHVHKEEKAKQEIEELQLTLAASQQTANEEIQRLKEEREASNKAIEELRAAEEAKLAEKDAEAKAIKEQLAALSATVEELRMPWWKKWFASAPGSAD